MKAVFIGCRQFSYSMLYFLINHSDIELVGVITQRQSSFTSDFCSLEPLALKAGVPCFLGNSNSRYEMISWIQNLKPDVMFCLGWSHLLSEELIQLPPLGVIGYHPTKLPLYRGRHPIIWTLALGLTETASTFFFIDGGIDSGDIISQKIIRVNPEDDAAVLYQKITRTALEQIHEITGQLIANTIKRTPQDHHQATYWRKREKKDGQIDWRMSSKTIHNLVRALTKPYGGANCVFNNNEVKIWKTELMNRDESGSEPGKVLGIYNRHMVIKCGEGILKLVEHEFKTLPNTGDFL